MAGMKMLGGLEGRASFYPYGRNYGRHEEWFPAD